MPLKTILKTAIMDFHKSGIPKFIKRDVIVPLDSNKIVTLIGPRRAGKTFMLYQLMSQVKDMSKIIYINFEDERLIFDSKNLQLIINAYFELYPSNKELYIFFDEIQKVNNWETFVRRLYDTVTKKIFLTGSSAKMLSKEIATSLRGRAISYEILPLSFKEYLRFTNTPEEYISTIGKARIMGEFERFMVRGGFPETVSMDGDIYQKTITSYFDVMLYRDVIERYAISKPMYIRELLKHLLSQSAKEFSINKIYNDFKSKGAKISKDSMYEYLNYLEDSFIVMPVSNYSESGRKQTLRKSYAIDTGFTRMLSFSLSKDLGRLFETLIFLELKRRGKYAYYFKNGGECDFIIKNGNVISEALQVCYEINESNKEREIRGLQSAMKRFKLKKGKIITLEQDWQERDIMVIPAIHWLLNE